MKRVLAGRNSNIKPNRFSTLHQAMFIRNPVYITPFLLLFFASCDGETGNIPVVTEAPPVSIERTGWLASSDIDEASGMQASHSREGDFFVHNDEGGPIIYVVDETGADLGGVFIVPAKNKDWEDITSVPVDDGRWIVVGDIGNNKLKRKSAKLYFAEEPTPGEHDRYSGRVDLQHWIELTFPDGPRDCEAMAYDPVGNQILFLTKRDKPSRLYAVDLETALTQEEAELTFLGTISALRPPTPRDRAHFGGRTDWISQPTGLDISADGTEAVIITYRSLYRFKREPDETWLSTMQRKPEEVVGPPAVQNEAITYSVDVKSIYVTTETRPAPMHRIEFTEADQE
jgi:hypothetical protein